ncbi:hypothetical protein CCR75_003231 [Bremia lactucae]|uniref:Uncharacterized protein n=1 Tax=Bremia lactucae TaxID=4779 RepID=A0A976FJX0_BRELC|nr:hypothetical protein CCR75_003231 [Bremia lactucae]
MAKDRQHIFSRSATEASAAAASTASMIRSNFATVSSALKNNYATNGSAAMSLPSLSRPGSAESLRDKETAKALPHHNKTFSIPSIMHIRTGFLDKNHSRSMASDSSTGSPEPLSQRSNISVDDAEHEFTTPRHAASAMKTASRFVMGMPTLLKRAVSNNHTLSNADPITTTPKKSPNAPALSTPREDFFEDNLEDNDRHSLLLMMQVPEGRNSWIPLMAVGEAW